MHKWKNPFVTLSLSPLATDEEIRKRAQLLSEDTSEDSMIARAAREELTQNIEKILTAFLTAVSGLSSIDGEIKSLKKKNKIKIELNNEILSDAFNQLGLSFEQADISMNDIEFSIIDNLRNHISIYNHSNELSSGSTPIDSHGQSDSIIKSDQQSTIQVPLILK